MKHVALIGPRGSGKSRLSEIVARQVQWPLVHVDDMAIARSGKNSVADIVAAGGWAHFRNLEHAALQEACALPTPHIIDCGGGICVEAPQADGADETFSTRKATVLKASAQVVYLMRAQSSLIEYASDAKRPELAANYAAVLTRRLPWYQQLADITLYTEVLSLHEAAADITAHITGKK